MGHPHESHDEMCLCHLSGAWHDKHNTYRWKDDCREALSQCASFKAFYSAIQAQKLQEKWTAHFYSSAFERVIEYTLLSLSMTNSAPSTGEVWARAIKARQSRGPSWICCDDNFQWLLFRFFSFHHWIFPKLLRYRFVSTPLLFLRQLAVFSMQRDIPYRDTPRTFLFIHFNSKTIILFHIIPFHSK